MSATEDPDRGRVTVGRATEPGGGRRGERDEAPLGVTVARSLDGCGALVGGAVHAVDSSSW